MGQNILIVDDMQTNRKLLKTVLKGVDNVEFHEAADGFQALDVISRREIDLVILDLTMPGKDGFGVLEDMKADDKAKEIPVIVYSAMDGIDSITKALELGAYDYFTKPLTPQQMQVILPLKIQNALESYAVKKNLHRINEKIKIELLMANLFQRMLMSEAKELSAVRMHGRCVASDEIGGVYYDCVETDGRTWFIMADVSWYGVAAAMITSMIQVEFNNSIRTLASPATVLQHMNATFYAMTNGNYFNYTAFIGVIDQDTLEYANAGHPHPVCYRADKDAVEVLELQNGPIGLSEESIYASGKLLVEKDDVILCYTDGLLQSRLIDDQASFYQDLSRFVMTYKQVLSSDPAEFINIVLQFFGIVEGIDAGDDVATMIIHKR